MEIITIATPSLGDRTSIVVGGKMAAVIDPQRDIDRILLVLDERGLRPTHVFETHIHNDYVTGGLDLARETGAAYVVGAADDVTYKRIPARDGDEFDVGGLKIRAVHTPGHTPAHLSYVAFEEGTARAVFTGGSMLYGTVGRTDLISEDATDALTRAQFRSVRRLAGDLPGDAEVHPTHGFGSFCSAAVSSGVERSTVGHERSSNLALTMDDEDRFVEELLSGLTAYPRYYAYVAPINRRGPSPVDLSPSRPVDAVEVRRRVRSGEWVVDVRSCAAYARRHLAGTINVEIGDSFITYLGWTMPWKTPITLVGDTNAGVAEAQRQMVRIGIDRPAGAADGGVRAWGAGGEIRSYRRATFADLAGALGGGPAIVLDVRRDDEWGQSHIDGALHIPLHDLDARLGEIPPGDIWVHCASGYRAAIAASLLDRAGRTPIVIDEDWAVAAKNDALAIGPAPV